ncbi:fimbrial protein, partial [Escherichia coli]
MKNATTKANADATEEKVGVLVGPTYNASALSVVKNRKASWGLASQVPAAAQIFAADFEVKPTLSAELKNYSGDVSLDGHTT